MPRYTPSKNSYRRDEIYFSTREISSIFKELQVNKQEDKDTVMKLLWEAHDAVNRYDNRLLMECRLVQQAVRDLIPRMPRTIQELDRDYAIGKLYNLLWHVILSREVGVGEKRS
ncbi:hypothetical protein N7495_009926 [Penicillium taxi]|uniref:uncharacterized protein n=1 Tax=Penicillium taxi TaxID=168475 RepID=UPI00254574C8|nr:uncharacterized protein N7495_009926 [Penicillium taxi]KAJ5885416.1 hypothetical protein N7495_009926 [Penicillium taxi]